MPNIEEQKLEAYSEEIQEIMGYIPRWVVRWGVTAFFLILLVMLLGSYFFKYPVVVSAPFVLTTVNPPAPIVPKSGGRITRWFVSDGQSVTSNSLIALLENTADYQDMKTVQSLLKSFSGHWLQDVNAIHLPHNYSLGKIQNTYVDFKKTYNNLGHYLQQDVLGKKTALLENRIKKQEEQFNLLMRQWELKKWEFKVAYSIYAQDSSAYFEGGYGIIRPEYERSLQTYLGQHSSKLAFEASIKNAEVSLLQLKESLLELQITREDDLNNLKNSLDYNFVSLQTQVNDWFENYILTSPIDGKITFTNYWSENQVINSGERLATVVPQEETIIIARAFIPSAALGRVQKGQKVNIKLSGFPYMEYGTLKGYINAISLVPEKEGYVVEIELSGGMTSGYGETLKFVQQMDGTADIVTEETRLIYRFINPLKMLVNN